MLDAITQLVALRTAKNDVLVNLTNEVNFNTESMAGSIKDYQRTGDEKWRRAYAKFAEDKERLEAQIDTIEVALIEQDRTIAEYKDRLRDLKSTIDNLQQEEAETVADIITTQKMNELNERLSGLASSTQTQNLQAIREARAKAKAAATVSAELTGPTDVQKLRAIAATSSRQSKHLEAFDAATKLDTLFVDQKVLTSQPAHTNKLDQMFKEEGK